MSQAVWATLEARVLCLSNAVDCVASQRIVIVRTDMMSDSIRWSEKPDYGFAIGRVRALEAGLIDASGYDRMVRSSGVDELIALAVEVGYLALSDCVLGGWSAVLDKAAEDNAVFLTTYSAENWLGPLFAVPRETMTIKRNVKTAVMAGKAPLAGVPARYMKAAETALHAYRDTGDPATIDQHLDRIAHELTTAAARPSDFLSRYYELSADLANLRTVVRLKLAKADAAELKRTFLPGGHLGLNGLSAALQGSWGDVAAGIRPASLRAVAEDGINYLMASASLLRLERRSRELLLRFLRKTRFVALGYEPLVAFYLLRENEITNLRALFAAKSAGLDESYCREAIAYAA